MGSVKKVGRKIIKEGSRTVERFKEDPLSALKKTATAATGVSILGPGATLAANKAKQEIDKALQPPEMPDMPEFPSMEPGGAGKAGDISTDVEMQDQVRKRRRGRASTILTGSRGLTPISEGSLARKTLLGF